MKKSEPAEVAAKNESKTIRSKNISIKHNYKKNLKTNEDRKIRSQFRSANKFDPHEIVRYPLSTEKSIRSIEFDNKLIFAVHPAASKADVKKAVELLFKVKVVKVNIQNSFSGDKKAYVKLGGESLASDVSADLGLI